MKSHGRSDTIRPGDRLIGGESRIAATRSRTRARGHLAKCRGAHLSLERADSVKSRSPAAASYRSERGLDRGDAERV